ncbi:ATP-binding protein [Caulobacter sp. 17J80-11]|uniref:ATP-binding protein n=1 Tax=Caulobacter sp. 17J80-11 TaxID=2763502 RepID=UPI00210712CE|nr:ATP-binding protein [Caulobacter sp. 17J80-11]
MEPASVDPTALPPAEFRRAVARQALDAQVKLLPYALGFFAVALVMFLAVGMFAQGKLQLLGCVLLYCLNWAGIYAAMRWLHQDDDRYDDVRLRAVVQSAGAALWVGALYATCGYAQAAGLLSPLLLMLCGGAAAGVIFFTSPYLPALAVLGPLAAAAPVLALDASHAPETTRNMVLSGLLLALALALILNRHLRGHFKLALEREGLIAERENALADAKKLTRSKSLILATLSHEIRNGLSGVAHVLAGALGAGSRGAPSREQLKAALHAARDLVEVLDATLDSETAEAGRLTLTPKPIDAGRLVQELVLLHRPPANAKGLEMVAQVGDELAAGGAVVGDSARVRQILNNLIGNAVKYTLRGRIEVRVFLAQPGRARFEVADTGPGLTAAEINQAFEPFSRVVRTGAGVPGAGLGLSLSRRLARLMNGDVFCDSAPGVGSRFWLELPFDPKAAAVEAVEPIAQTRSMRVLVAEDDALNAAMLRAVLEQLGHKVLHAQDGRRALDLLALGEIDLIMLDGRMPGMDGPTTARALRELDGPEASLPVVAVIGGDAEEAQAMLAAGADSVLRKPVTVAGVARAVADAARAGSRGEKKVA